MLNRNIINNCKRSLVKSFYIALNDYSPQEADGITFKDEYTKKLYKNFFSSVANYSNFINDPKNSDENLENNFYSENQSKDIDSKIKEKVLNANTIKVEKKNYNDTEPPILLITNFEVIEKKGIVEGQVKDNIDLAELKIIDKNIYFSNNCNFSYSTFVPPEELM